MIEERQHVTVEISALDNTFYQGPL